MRQVPLQQNTYQNVDHSHSQEVPPRKGRNYDAAKSCKLACGCVDWSRSLSTVVKHSGIPVVQGLSNTRLTGPNRNHVLQPAAPKRRLFFKNRETHRACPHPPTHTHTHAHVRTNRLEQKTFLKSAPSVEAASNPAKAPS